MTSEQLARIDAQARQMRAEVMRDMIRGIFRRQPARTTQTQAA
jgi:hypothetical protein